MNDPKTPPWVVWLVLWAAMQAGVVVFPQHKQGLFLLSVLGLAQFVPAFARRYFAQDPPSGKV
jgi:hypothetical protein